jgi:hypothetical protein
MTTLRLTLVILSLGVPLSAADLSGVWSVSLKADWTNIPALVCKFSQNGQQLTGSCAPPGASSRDTVDLTGGTVEGDRVTCQWRVVTPDGQTWTYALTGTLDAKETTIEGSFTLSSVQTTGGGSFSAKKQ